VLVDVVGCGGTWGGVEEGDDGDDDNAKRETTTERKADVGTSGSGRPGLMVTADVGACEMLIRERVVSMRGNFQNEAMCLSALVVKLVSSGAMYSMRGPRPAEGWSSMLTKEERNAMLDASARYGEMYQIEEADWVYYGAFVKHNTVTKSVGPAPTPTSGFGFSAGYVQCSMVMFDVIGACNHSCDPNAEVSSISDDGAVTLYSLRPIQAGEEITICYGKPMIRWLPARLRRRALRREWKFECSCRRCTLEITTRLSTSKQPSRPWDILDPRWFFSTHDYVTGFESHFNAEGELLALRPDSYSSHASNGGDNHGNLESSLRDMSLEDDCIMTDESSSGSESTDLSEYDEDEDEFEAEHSSSGSEDEDVMRWHEKWRSTRLSAYSVKHKGMLTPLQLYLAMQRCQIRQDHWQFLVVRDALIIQLMSEASEEQMDNLSRPPAPVINGDKFKAFKLLFNQCRSLSRMMPNSANFAELFATLENVHYWHARDGEHARKQYSRAADSSKRQSRMIASSAYFDIPERWEFRLANLRDGIHADVLAWNFSFCKSPGVPF
jgi:hypothetical protein